MRHIQDSQQLQRAAGHPLVIEQDTLSELLSDHAMDWYGSVAFLQDIYYIECLTLFSAVFAPRTFRGRLHHYCKIHVL